MIDLERGAAPCPHDLGEQETACADGLCPLCLVAELRQAREDAARWRTLMAIDPDKGKRLLRWERRAKPHKPMIVDDVADREMTIEHEDLPVYEWYLCAVGETMLQAAIDATRALSADGKGTI